MSVRALCILAVVGTSYCAPLAGMAGDPVYPAREWETRAPQAVGLDPLRLREAADLAGGNGCVVRGGVMAFTWGDRSQRIDVASAAKPVYVHLLLAALESKKIKSLDEPVTMSMPALANVNERLGHKDRKIAWRHLANQTSCYGVSEQPGEAFDYSDYNMALLFDALVVGAYRSTHEDVDRDVLQPLVTEPLGCQDRPTLLAFGKRDRPGRLALSVRDFARFGLLNLRVGQWRDQRLVSVENVKLVTTSPLPLSLPRTRGIAADMIAGQRSIGGGNNQTDHLGSYSFAWWTNGIDREGRRHWPDSPACTFAALGHDSMRALVVVPNLDLVICWNGGKVRGRNAANRVLRAIVEATKKVTTGAPGT